jgi:DNA-binding NtrC family response regulator
MEVNPLFKKYQGIKILIIDDDLEVQSFVNRVLTGLRFNTILASDGITGLEKFEKNSPDILITDIYMPGKNGLIVAKEAQSIKPEVPIILMSGFANLESTIYFSRPHITAALSKPFSVNEIILVLQKALLELEKSGRGMVGGKL